MNLASSTVALTLLTDRGAVPAAGGQVGIAARSSAASMFAAEPVGSNDTYIPADSSVQESFDWKSVYKQAAEDAELSKGLRNGEISPFADIKYAKVYSNQTRELQPGMEPEGLFLVTSAEQPMGSVAPLRDASFPARSDAMALAYHFAKYLSVSIELVSGQVSAANNGTDYLRDETGKFYGVDKNGYIFGNDSLISEADTHGSGSFIREAKNMENIAATLSNLFSTDLSAVTSAAYEGKTSGFSLVHSQLGKILGMSADGSITLYAENGTAYNSAEYNAKNIDGGIPELRNDMRGLYGTAI